MSFRSLNTAAYLNMFKKAIAILLAKRKSTSFKYASLTELSLFTIFLVQCISKTTQQINDVCHPPLEMQKKYQRINSLLVEIKAKLEKLQAHSNNLKLFNVKIKALNEAFRECNSIIENDKKENETNSVEEEMEEFDDMSEYEYNTSVTPDNNNALCNPMYDNTDQTASFIAESEPIVKKRTLQSILLYASSLLSKDQKTQQNLKKIVNLLHEQKEVSLNNIVTACGIPKYRAVDILGKLSGAQRPLVSKRYDKEFFYTLVDDE
ncbi:hypothetical protein VCUG_02521 [Vavraia culicis subsp. floridensis]|uniref:Uncharacterized protein n=1 Tax=Vavraia culicis (isolate floridensis) TaxID=948595 RepID=L2GRS9_VAVCU|nr:uncharacterized protein VCUG_02521 [Vavraia culicis subsp. floridensis]ELA45988.1 hypothetical protein VCUG_02521 [Vavraia culicis subsp. floridensis]